MSYRISPHSRFFVLFLAALSWLPPFSIDMGLPAIPTLAVRLHTEPDTAALTLSLFMFGYALGPLLYGPLSDHFGRRPVLLYGCCTFAVAAVACSLSTSIQMLLAFRLLQGAGAGAGTVMAMAIIRDLFEGKEGRKLLSYVSMIITVAPMVAPTIGAAILAAFGWRWIYGTLAAGGILILAVVLFGFEESLRRPMGTTLSVKRTTQNYLRVLRNPITRGYALINACSFGGMFSYVTGSPLVLIDKLGVSPTLYGFLFALGALGIMAGSFTSGRLSHHDIEARVVLPAGLVASSLAALFPVAATLLGMVTVPVIVGPILVVTFCLGLTRPYATHGALQPMADIAGVASALLSTIQIMTGAIAGALVATLFDRLGVLAMTGGIAFFTLLNLIVYFFIVMPATPRLETSRNPT